MIKPVWIIGFAGHRPRPQPGRTSGELTKLEPVIRRVLEDLKQRAERRGGRADLLCSVAAGADLAAARAAESLGMCVHVILPEREEATFGGFGSAGETAEAQRFIRMAREGIGGATFRVSPGPQVRDECFYDAAVKIVEASDALVAVWDGLPAPASGDTGQGTVYEPGRGGTADFLALAAADRMPFLKGKSFREGCEWRPTPCLVIDAVSGAVSGSAENFAPADDAGIVEISAAKRTAEKQLRRSPVGASPEELLALADSSAIDWAWWFRRLLVTGVLLHGSASLVAAITAAAQRSMTGTALPVYFAVLELALVTIALFIMGWTHLRQTQARWLELRIATELTRSLHLSRRLTDPLFPQITGRLPRWRRFCMSIGLEVWRLSPADWNLESEIARYRTERIEKQISHYSERNPGRWFFHRIIRSAGVVAAVGAVAVVILSLMQKVNEAAHPAAVPSAWWEILLYRFLPVALPLIAGTAAALQAAADSKRRATVYPEVIERLRSSAGYIGALRTRASLQDFVARTEEILTDELIGWYAAARSISR